MALAFVADAAAGEVKNGVAAVPSCWCLPAPPAQVVESTGFVVVPYLEYPQLLGMLLRMLSEGSPGVRREVMKVLGIIGALDPHTHKVRPGGAGGAAGREEGGSCVPAPGASLQAFRQLASPTRPLALWDPLCVLPR